MSEDYYKTERWRTLAEAAKSAAGNRCMLCNRKAGLEAHHRTYGSKHTPAELGDIVALCDFCHGWFHACHRYDGVVNEYVVDTDGLREMYVRRLGKFSEKDRERELDVFLNAALGCRTPPPKAKAVDPPPDITSGLMLERHEVEDLLECDPFPDSVWREVSDLMKRISLRKAMGLGMYSASRHDPEHYVSPVYYFRKLLKEEVAGDGVVIPETIEVAVNTALYRMANGAPAHRNGVSS